MPEKIDRELLKKCFLESIGEILEAKREPKACSKCGKSLYGKDERETGVCSQCEVASWSPEKKAAMNRLISIAFQDPRPSETEIDQTIDEALKHVPSS